jgi:hypothetical protein
MYRIVTSPYHPKNKPVYGTFTAKAHPFVEWLSRWIPFDPNEYFSNVVLSYTWADPFLVDDSGLYLPINKTPNPTKAYILICSEEQAKELKNALTQRKIWNWETP